MRILLDTCTFLWLNLDATKQLSKLAVAEFRDPNNAVFLSAASAWEIAVKHSLDRLRLDEPPDAWVRRYRTANGIQSLAIDEESALQTTKLPWLHRDPFDRILVSQAIVHGLVILTPDPDITQYPARTLW